MGIKLYDFFEFVFFNVFFAVSFDCIQYCSRQIQKSGFADFQFDFSEGGTIEIELDILRNHWGTVFGVGYDANGDGVVLPPMNYETTEPNPRSIHLYTHSKRRKQT